MKKEDTYKAGGCSSLGGMEPTLSPGNCGSPELEGILIQPPICWEVLLTHTSPIVLPPLPECFWRPGAPSLLRHL